MGTEHFYAFILLVLAIAVIGSLVVTLIEKAFFSIDTEETVNNAVEKVSKSILPPEDDQPCHRVIENKTPMETTEKFMVCLEDGTWKLVSIRVDYAKKFRSYDSDEWPRYYPLEEQAKDFLSKQPYADQIIAINQYYNLSNDTIFYGRKVKEEDNVAQ